MRALPRLLSLPVIVVAGLLLGVGLAEAATLPRTPDPYPFELGGDVHAMTRSGDTLYLGGDFTYLGPRIRGLARLDGAGVPDDAFPEIQDGSVTAVAADGAGGWYAAGSFTRIGGVERYAVAHVLADGTVDPAFDAGIPDDVLVEPRAMVRYDGALYVAISMPGGGGQSRTGLTAFDATTGAVLPFDAALDGEVSALEIHDGRLYVGGSFTQAAGQPRDGIAAFSLATGQLTAFAPDLDNQHAGVAVSAIDAGGGRLYITGSFVQAGGTAHERIAALDPVTGAAEAWAPRLSGAMSGIAYSADTGDVYVFGAYSWLNQGDPGARFATFHAIDAVTGQHVAVPWTGTCSAMQLVGTTLHLACTFFDNGRYPAAVRAFDVRTWDEVFTSRLRGRTGNGDPEVRALGVAGGGVVAGGTYQTIGGRIQDRLAAIDLGTGEPLPFNPGANGTVRALEVVDGDVVAAGDFTAVGGVGRLRAARLDPVTGAPRAWDPAVTGGAVRALARDGDTLYLGGDFTAVEGQARTFAGAVSLATGDALAFAPQVSGTQVNALAVDPGGVILGGRFTQVGGQARPALAAVDATGALRAGWNASIAQNGGTPEVLALTRDGTEVFAGGVFTSAGGAARRDVAALEVADGSADAWNAGLTEGLGVYAIAVRGDDVYLGGSKTPPAWNGDTAIFNRHRRSDGGSVESLIMIDSIIRAIHLDRSSLFLGGSFEWVGYTVQERRGFASMSLPPESTRSPAITGTPAEGETLTCGNGTWANDPVRFTYAWRRDGTGIGGATAATYVAAPADAGATLTCAVTAHNRGGSVTAVSAAAGGPAPPSADAPPQVTGTVAYDAQLTCALGTWSGDVGSHTVRWLRDGDLLDGATQATYRLTNDDAARAIACRVTAIGAGGQTTVTAAPVQVPDRPALTVSPSVTGTAEPGETLTCAPGTWSSPSPVTFRYSWTIDGVEVGTGSTFVVREADRTKTLRCDVRATNAGGWAEAFAGQATVPGLPPVNTGAPSIAGTARAGQVLLCSPGTWSGSFDVRDYEWDVDGVPVMVWPADRLTLTVAHRGKTIRCRETARSWSWGQTTAESAAVVVGWDPPSPDGPPVVAGAARPGETLTCRPGTWTDADRVDVAWRRDGRDDAAGTTRAVTAQDTGATFACRVTATGRGGTTMRESDPVSVPAPAPPPAEPPPPAPAPAPSPPHDDDPPAAEEKRRTPSDRDRLKGGAKDDLFRGLEGDDLLDGGGGNDRLFGGPGRDKLIGGPGLDLLDGGPGDDVLDGRDRRGGDRLRCGPGRDRSLADRGDRVARDCERVIRR
jgi:hypothetical protein